MSIVPRYGQKAVNSEMATHTQKERSIMDNWYVMSVLTGKENSSVEDIRVYNIEKSIDHILPFVPTRETFFKKNGDIKKETSIMFPGYLFIETSIGTYDFFNYVKDLRRKLHNTMTVLKYGESNEIAIRWEERLVLMKLMNHEWCVKTSLGFKENDTVKIKEGALVGCEGQIKKIDRHKMIALIEMNIFKKKSLIEVGLQIIK